MMNFPWRTTKEVSQETGIPIDTLRYDERIGLIQGVHRALNERHMALRLDILSLIEAKISQHKAREKALRENAYDHPIEPMAGRDHDCK